MPVIAYAQPVPGQWSPVILGRQVQLRATPAEYVWDFGDGSAPLSTASPGAPFPDETLTHTYTGTGGVQITLTTVYTGEYSLDGGATWVPVPGTATATTPPVDITIVEARAVLTG